MAIARQTVGHAFQNVSSSSATWSKTTLAGSFLLLDVAVNGGSAVTVPTPAGWTKYSTDLDQSTNVMIATFYQANAPATSGAQSISVTLSDGVTPSARWGSLFLREYTGLAITGTIDKNTDATGSSTTADTGVTAGVTNANEVAVGILAHADAPTVATFGANTTGYTQLWQSQSTTTGSNRLEAIIYEKQLAGAGSTFRLTDTISASKPWAARVLSLSPVSTSPGTPTVPPAQGLFRAGATSLQSDRLPPVMNGITVYPDWSQLEASNTGALNGTAVAMIDSAVTYCTSNGLLLKIRLFCNGNNAAGGVSSCPSWLNALCGTFKHANSQLPNSPETMVRFWVQPFLDYYDRLQSLMSARWDSNACLVDVTISNAMMKYAEPLIRDLSIKANRAELVGGDLGFSGAFINKPGAGYNPTDQVGYVDQTNNINAIKAGMDTHARYWPNTCSSFSFNPYQRLTTITDFNAVDDNNNQQTAALMDYMRQVLGPRAVLENNSVRDSYFTYDATGAATGTSTNAGAYKPMYDYMVSKGPPLFYQTATQSPQRIGDLAKTMDGIVNVLAGNAVEPPTNYETVAGGSTSDAAEYSVASFTTYNAELIANPTGAGTTSVVTKSSSDQNLSTTETPAVTVTTSGVITKTDTDLTPIGSDASVIAAPLPVISNPTGHKPAKRS